MREGKITFLIMDLIFLVVLGGLIFLIFKQSGLFFIGEIIMLFALIFISIIAMVAIFYNARWGWALSSVIFGLILINLIFMYSQNVPIGRAFLIITVLATIGFMTSILSIKTKRAEKAPEVELIKEDKFVASKTGSTYHKPDCDWAKKIKKKNQVWFDEEKEAKKKYKPHSCLK